MRAEVKTGRPTGSQRRPQGTPASSASRMASSAMSRRLAGRHRQPPHHHGEHGLQRERRAGVLRQFLAALGHRVAVRTSQREEEVAGDAWVVSHEQRSLGRGGVARRRHERAQRLRGELAVRVVGLVEPMHLPPAAAQAARDARERSPRISRARTRDGRHRERRAPSREAHGELRRASAACASAAPVASNSAATRRGPPATK